MYIYNVTTNVQEDVHDKWVQWMKEEHIPEMLNTGKFTKAIMTRVLVKEEMGGITYSVQYSAESKEQLQKYYEENAPELRGKTKAFEGKIVSFRTELEVVSEQ
ncbi:DUF4286 family protein [Salinimicrobium sp. GXAS 041]|uniref:DUF4286 family protein n=1 Tax=Salinimicrobium sp. GXAS 041 TaxID=3400806 RepID=UPI003C765D98